MDYRILMYLNSTFSPSKLFSMNKIFLVLFCMLMALRSYSQLGITGSSPTGSLYIAPNTIFHVDSLIIIPATGNALTLQNNSIVRVATPVTTVSNGNSIERVFNMGATFSFVGHMGLIFKDSELNGNTKPSLQVAYNTGSAWVVTSTSTFSNSFGTNAQYVTNEFASSINVNRFTATTLGNTLPINFTGFSAQLKGQAVAVNWQTDLTTSIEGFYVQSSSNGSTWADVGYVAAQSGREKYSYNDANIDFTVRYYRVMGVEPSGEKTYTKIALVKQSAENIKLTVMGSIGARTIRFINDTPDGIQLYDLKGQLIKRVNTSQRDYPVIGVPAGVYIVKFTLAGEQFTKRVVL